MINLDEPIKVKLEYIHTSRLAEAKELAKSYGAKEVKYIPIRNNPCQVNLVATFRLHSFKATHDAVREFRKAYREAA